MAMQLRDSDIAQIFNMVQSGNIRDASGIGNNIANPTWGAAGQPFIRLTTPSYSDGVSGLPVTTFSPREVSDIVSNQDNDGDGTEENIPNGFGGSAFLTFFGQYFDHGLDLIGKGGASIPIGSSTFLMNATRANPMPGTGNADGIPNSGDEVPAQYINPVSPYADQNQTYGSSEAVTDLLRKWVQGPNGPVETAYLLMGNTDGSGHALLPTLNHVRQNYRIMTGGELTSDDIANFDGTGHALLLDFIPAFKGGNPANGLDLDALGNYYIAGDGRVNENVVLTSIHTIWARNHNFWVDHLRARTGNTWTEEQYFQAAKIINIAEYQNIVFGEFADAMAGGIKPGDPAHGFTSYDPTVNAAISAEFANSAYRFGHSMLNETVSFKNADGSLGNMSLVQAFLSPDKVNQIGVEELLLGATGVTHQAIDVDIVNALRNQLVGQPLDLAALNIFRGRDTGIAPFNAVRAELFAKTGDASLLPYSGWADFQQRNGLSNAFIAQLQQAYPEGFQAMDLWVGGLAERPSRGQLGSTFGYIFIEQLDRLQKGDRFYYLQILDNTLFSAASNIETFSDIIARNSNIKGLAANVFLASPNGSTSGSKGIIVPPPDQPPQQPQDPVTPDTPTGPFIGTAKSDNLVGSAHDDLMKGGRGNDILHGLDGNDRLYGEDGNDRLDGGAGIDRMWGGRGNDVFVVDNRQDRTYESRNQGTDTVKSSVSYSLSGTHVERLYLDGSANINGTGNSLDNRLYGNAGNNVLKASSGNDIVRGYAGNDKLYGGSGNDKLSGGAGDDWLYGGPGQDVFVFEKNSGRDRIKDFQVGLDKIDVRAWSNVHDLADLRMTQSGAHVVIHHGADMVVVEHVQLAALSLRDFLL
ncbi:peroxidase family protein [Microvirga subterranea]|uniref:Hemolysin type calcium-binding protein n=1 Tax=Microvirga subterranea TaxID=186651 RepID=A0A370HIA0_9HYPH|nr:peroxidase family protein [Microvirga subterranea]RDI57921.1 hemolysin type calcium-binding protein [Microvirga subterranea]